VSKVTEFQLHATTEHITKLTLYITTYTQMRSCGELIPADNTPPPHQHHHSHGLGKWGLDYYVLPLWGPYRRIRSRTHYIHSLSVI